MLRFHPAAAAKTIRKNLVDHRLSNPSGELVNAWGIRHSFAGRWPHR
jgi:hypothetical protein